MYCTDQCNSGFALIDPWGLADSISHPDIVRLLCYSPSQRSSIQLERSSHQEEAGLKLLQDHHALALVDSSQDNGNHSGGEGASH